MIAIGVAGILILVVFAIIIDAVEEKLNEITEKILGVIFIFLSIVTVTALGWGIGSLSVSLFKLMWTYLP